MPFFRTFLINFFFALEHSVGFISVILFTIFSIVLLLFEGLV